MTRLEIIIIGLLFSTSPVISQTKDTVAWKQEQMDQFYLTYSPLDYLSLLKTDFKRKDKMNVFVVMPSPYNWVKEEHIPELLKLIYSTDSIKSIMNAFSSSLPTNQFSTVGREAQNLIECFKLRKSYPIHLNSFGPPDKVKGKEIEDWWERYKMGRK